MSNVENHDSNFQCNIYQIIIKFVGQLLVKVPQVEKNGLGLDVDSIEPVEGGDY